MHNSVSEWLTVPQMKAQITWHLTPYFLRRGCTQKEEFVSLVQYKVGLIIRNEPNSINVN